MTIQIQAAERCRSVGIAGVPAERSLRQLVINADDLAICESTNDAIRDAHEDGVLTSASLMANGPAFHHALTSVIERCPNLGVGIHLNLTTGRCLSPPGEVPLLADSRGRFRLGFASLARVIRRHRDAALEQITQEIRRQLDFVRAAGVNVDHIDSHRHVHMLPSIFAAVAQLGVEANCIVRVSHEPFAARSLRHFGFALSAIRNCPKRLILSTLAKRCRPDATESVTPVVFGVLSSGLVSRPAMDAMIDAWSTPAAELITHPGCGEPSLSDDLQAADRAFHASIDRVKEHRALVAPSTRALFSSAGIELIRFADLRGSSISAAAVR